LAIAPYTTYTSYIHYTGSTDSTLLQNFFYDTATFVPQYKINFDSLTYMVDYLSTLYGRYPFWKEKYGVCYSTLPGGMEHQTMTTIGTTLTPLIAHELGHQWFGDHVTYRTWPHVWLSEGFATYTEQLFVNKFWGSAAAYTYRKGQYNNVMSVAGGRVFVDDTTSPSTLFDQRLVYYKGAGVVHMLRFQAPSDSVFFALLQTYQQQFANGFATTEDLKALAESMYGISLDSFFNQWIYEKGYPTYSASWNQSGSTVYVKLQQTTSVPLSVHAFDMPIEIELKSGLVDTIVKVYNNSATQYYSFTWNTTVDSVFIDPNLWIIHKNGSIVYDSTLSVPFHAAYSSKLNVVPNPSSDYWLISGLQDNAQLDLYNMAGSNLWSRKGHGASVKIPGMNLKPGNYMLRVRQQGYEDIAMQLIHW
jgi:aminopeptidase N